MPASVEFRLGGEPVELHAQRALYWPARRRLLIADLHLGKADVFRRAGIGLPRGGTSGDLARLARLVETTGARELWVLGDMLHGAVHGSPWRESWHAWRVAHPALAVAAITGNHDRALADAALGIELLGGAVDDGPFALRHDPEQHPHRHVLCGHLHPLVSLPGMRRRWPAFWIRAGITVLPAFSAFTAGVAVNAGAGERLAICAEDDITLLRG